MDLQTFLKANIKKEAPNMVPVSHPERGFDIVNKKYLALWKGWGWQEESWDVVVSEPAGAKKTTAKTKRATKKKVEEPKADTDTEV